MNNQARRMRIRQQTQPVADKSAYIQSVDELTIKQPDPCPGQCFGCGAEIKADNTLHMLGPFNFRTMKQKVLRICHRPRASMLCNIDCLQKINQKLRSV